MNRIPEDIEVILADLFAGEATETDVQILRDWLGTSASNPTLLKEYRDIDDLLKRYGADRRYNASAAWQSIRTAIRHKRVRQAPLWIKTAWRYAAAVLFAFGTGATAMYYLQTAHTNTFETASGESEIFFSEYTVPYGSKSMVTLPDSSTIWLNAGSKLRYGSSFNRMEREVFIEGEAYFKVTKDETKPFYVRTSVVTLKVLGTSFNVKAYSEENNVETTVETGSVQVLRNMEGRLTDKLVLTAGQKATVIKSDDSGMTATQPSPVPAKPEKSLIPEIYAGKTIIAKNVSTKLYTSWKDVRWLIEKEPLGSLAVKLERRYNVRIAFSNEALKDMSFSGTLKDESIEQVLEALFIRGWRLGGACGAGISHGIGGDAAHAHGCGINAAAARNPSLSSIYSAASCIPRQRNYRSSINLVVVIPPQPLQLQGIQSQGYSRDALAHGLVQQPPGSRGGIGQGHYQAGAGREPHTLRIIRYNG